MIFWCLLSTLELLTICLSVQVLLVNARWLSAPQKWKDRSNEDLDFWLCNLGFCTIKRDCSMKCLGDIILVQNTLATLCNLLERTLQNSCCWSFSGRRLWPSKLETLACQAGDFDSEPETPARESGLPNSFFTRVVQAFVVGLESRRCTAKDSEIVTWEPKIPVLIGWETPGGTGDSGPYRSETPGLVDPNG
jgi:hypothetical protein